MEGQKTEEDYLVHWHRRHRERVNVNISQDRGTPKTLVEAAVKAKRKAEAEEKRGRGRAYDEVWCVFDVDAHPLLSEAKDMAQANGIHLAVSNPCIELWFALHFEDHTRHIERHDAQAISRMRLSCGKGLTPDALELLEANHGQARDRAQALDVKHAGDGSPAGANPSSSVWRIVDAIASA